MERASAAIAAAGGPGDAPRIEGPQGKTAVHVDGASLSLTGVAVAATGGIAVYCESKGRAELAGCALSSPRGTGLWVSDGATAEVQGGSIADCGYRGVYCFGSGSKATVRTARPRTAETRRSTPRPLAAIFARLPSVSRLAL